MSLLRRLMPAMALMMAGGHCAMAADEPWDTWRRIPVLHDGRIMPLDTFAKTAVAMISGSARPTLAVPDDLPQIPHVFGRRHERKVDAGELLFSWLIEPEAWEDVPLIRVGDSELREKYLDLPPVEPDEEDAASKYVSPRQVSDADAFWIRRAALADKAGAARARGESMKLEGTDREIQELYNAYSLYRHVTYDPRTISFGQDKAIRRQQRFMAKLGAMSQQWQTVASYLGILEMIEESRPYALEIETSIGKIGELIQKGRDVPVEEVAPVIQRLASASRMVDLHMRKRRESIHAASPEGFNQEQTQALRSNLRKISFDMKEFAKACRQLQIALFDSDNALRLVPALDPDALEAEREPSDDAQPWLSIQAIVYGTDAVMSGYPPTELAATRSAFATLKNAFLIDESDAPTLGKSMRDFADSLRSLGEAVSPKLAELPIEKPDDALIRYVTYPAPRVTDAEIHYNDLRPFEWSCAICFAAFACFCFAVGRPRPVFFWMAMLLAGGGLLWTAYGFYLRILITKWAPVTNMYETMIYVPFFVMSLGAWFVLLPLTWTGFKAAWRLTAVPGIWEASSLTEEQHDMMDRSTWAMGNWCMQVLRVPLTAAVFWVLAVAPYAAGERTILRLTPSIDGGASLPDANDLLTWVVGLCVLVPGVWYLPRFLLTAVLSLVTIPWTLRGHLAERLPQVYPRRPFGLAATFVPFMIFLLAWYIPDQSVDANASVNKSFGPLMPILRDNFWLTIHVLTIVSSYGAGALTWGVGNLSLGFYLFGKYRPAVADTASGERLALGEGHRPAASSTQDNPRPARRAPEACSKLAGQIYKAMQVAVLLLVAGTILGALWADVSWGRFWGWDPKEVWALVSALVYLVILHGRFAGWLGNFGLAAGTVFGATAIVMSWYGVNFWLGVGLHAYAFGTGGLSYVLIGVAANMGFLGLAATRLLLETRLR